MNLAMESRQCILFLVEVLVFTTVMVKVGFSNQQRTREPNECCFSSFINDTQTATAAKECVTGFHGPKCEKPCRYPNYGLLCQKECNCTTEQYCNHITGCQDVPDPCLSTKRSSTNDVMLISTIVLTLIAVLQFSVYLSLRFIHLVK